VLLIHGNPGSHADFAELAPRLELASEVLAFDLPGFESSGRDKSRDAPSDLAALADVAFSIVDQRCWREFDVIGHSHGAAIAQAMAWSRPERIGTLMLLGSLGRLAHLAYRQLAAPGASWALSLSAHCVRLPGGRAWLRTVQKPVLDSAFFPQLPPPGRLESEVERVLERPQILVRMAQLAGARPCAELAGYAERITTPTHFIHGESDRLVPVRYPRALHERRIEAGRASTFDLVLGAGHMLPITHAEYIAERYRFLAQACAKEPAGPLRIAVNRP
jgi:pimeloyl-ACP methyl ester carboxylesterase